MISTTYDLDLPPLVTVVFCTLQYWMLSRSRRKSSSKLDKSLDRPENADHDVEVADVTNASVVVQSEVTRTDDALNSCSELLHSDGESIYGNNVQITAVQDDFVCHPKSCDKSVTLINKFSVYSEDLDIEKVNKNNESLFEDSGSSKVEVPDQCVERDYERDESIAVGEELETSFGDSTALREGTEPFSLSHLNLESQETDYTEFLQSEEVSSSSIGRVVEVAEREELISRTELEEDNELKRDDELKSELEGDNEFKNELEGDNEFKNELEEDNEFKNELEEDNEYKKDDELKSELDCTERISKEDAKEEEDVKKEATSEVKVAEEAFETIPESPAEKSEPDTSLRIEIVPEVVHNLVVSGEEVDVANEEDQDKTKGNVQRAEGGEEESMGEVEAAEESEGKAVKETSTEDVDACHEGDGSEATIPGTARVEDSEEGEDVKSQLSGMTNEVSEDSGVDEAERNRRTASSTRSSKSESCEDCDSCLSSEEATLATKSENDASESDECPGVPGDPKEGTSALSSSSSVVVESRDSQGWEEEEEQRQEQYIINSSSFTSYFSFSFPQAMAGRLIGREGSVVRSIHREVGVAVEVHLVPYQVGSVRVNLSGPDAGTVLRGLEVVRKMFASYSCVDFDAILSESPDVGEARRAVAEEWREKFDPICLKFHFPSDLVGWLIGTDGSSIYQLTTAARAEIRIEPAEEDGAQTLVIIGLPGNVEKAIEMIRSRCPAHDYPEVELDKPLPQVETKKVELSQFSFVPVFEGMEVVRVTSVCSVDRIFVHRVALHVNSHLRQFSSDLNRAYAEGPRHPLPHPIRQNTLCVVELNGAFYRAMTLDCRRHDCRVMFVDFGGDKVYKHYELLVIRQQFIDYSFQAVECFVDGIFPMRGQEYSRECLRYWQQELANKEFLARPVYTDMEGRTFVELFRRGRGSCGRGEGGPSEGLINVAEEAASALMLRYNPWRY